MRTNIEIDDELLDDLHDLIEDSLERAAAAKVKHAQPLDLAASRAR